jgi:hypothetical protein
MMARREDSTLSALAPYLVATALSALVAIVQALGASFVSFDRMPDFPGSRWLRIHLVTLGIVTELAFGIVSERSARADGDGPHWGVWASLNAGLVTLIVGIPLVNAPFIVAGGALVFAAVLLLMRRVAAAPRGAQRVGVGDGAFHLAGLGFLLVGVTLGTGLWLGWDTDWLRAANPREAHVHANGFGFTALILAGILMRLVSQSTTQPLLTPATRRVVLWGMILGAAGLVAGPWVGSHPLTVAGLLAHVVATGIFLRQLWRAFRDSRGNVGILHLFGAYVWFFAPLLVTPLVILGVGGLTEDLVGVSAPPTLIYGWMLQAVLALAPPYAARAFRPEGTATLGGTWWTLAAVNLGAILQWLAVLDRSRAGMWSGLAFAAWSLALIGLAYLLWAAVRPARTATPHGPSRSEGEAR